MIKKERWFIMDIKQMKEMILSGENISVEFKESKNELNLSSLETVVAFLNKKGGYCPCRKIKIF